LKVAYHYWQDQPDSFSESKFTFAASVITTLAFGYILKKMNPLSVRLAISKLFNASNTTLCAERRGNFVTFFESLEKHKSVRRRPAT